tara:strand:+ start:295 stop:618 length:324 start_codon:yes stop_codon:yes gene_type:complete
MKKTISTIINLSHTSFLGGYLQFGINYNPDNMTCGGGTKCSRFALALGFITLEFYANTKTFKQLSFKLNGTDKEIQIEFGWKNIMYNYRKMEQGNYNHKCELLYSWS